MAGERKGILGAVTLQGKPLLDWQNYALPFAIDDNAAYSHAPCKHAPCVYRATFDAPASGNADADTFLDTKGLGKGVVWLNGHPLGRFWNIGPQRTLYVPGAWLKPSGNQLIVLDLLAEGQPVLHTVKRPMLGATKEAQ